MSAVAILLSGGTGSRLGADIPKQYIEINGAPVIRYPIRTLLSHPGTEMLCIVCQDEWRAFIMSQVETCRSEGLEDDTRILFAHPGVVRQESIYKGLLELESTGLGPDTPVIITDAARPLVTHELLDRCLEALPGHDGVMPVIPMKDTVYESRDGKSVSGLLDRSTIYAGQAPEFYYLGNYTEAVRKLTPDEILTINGTTEVAIWAGMDVVMVPGDEDNFKITTQADLERFELKTRE